jgi:hypothetical protein
LGDAVRNVPDNGENDDGDKEDEERNKRLHFGVYVPNQSKLEEL